MKRGLWLALLILVLVIPVTAQADTTVAVGELDIVLPEGWSIAEDGFATFYDMVEDLEPVVLLHENGLEAQLVSPEKIADLVPNADDLSHQDLLIELVNLAYEFDISEEEFFTVDLGAVDGLRWAYEDTGSVEDLIMQGDVYVIPLTEGGYLFADIYAMQDVFQADTEAVEASMEELFISAGAVLLDESQRDTDSNADLPDGWVVAEDDYQSFYVMTDEFAPVVLLHDTGLEALIVSAEQVAELLPNAAEMSYQDILVDLGNRAYDIDLAEEGTEFFTVDLGAVDGLRWFYDDTESDTEPIRGDLYVIPLTDGGYLFADIYAYQKYFEEETDAMESAMEELFITMGAAVLDK